MSAVLESLASDGAVDVTALVERLGVRTGGPGGVVMVIVVSAAGAIAAITYRPSEPSE